MVNKSDTAPRFNREMIEAACRDGEADAINNLSNAILVALRKRQSDDWPHPISHGHIADSEAANFAYRMLQACERQQRPPSRTLVELFQVILKQDRPPHRRTLKYVQREEARRYVKSHPGAGVREIARVAGVSPSTVSRWGKLLR